MSEYMQGGAIAEDDFDFSATRERARTVGRASAAAKSPALNVAIGVSAAVVVVGVVLWAMQLSGGMVQTAMRNLDSWGLYITGFMFFVGLSAGGLIISSVPKAFGIAASAAFPRWPCSRPSPARCAPLVWWSWIWASPSVCGSYSCILTWEALSCGISSFSLRTLFCRACISGPRFRPSAAR